MRQQDLAKYPKGYSYYIHSTVQGKLGSKIRKMSQGGQKRAKKYHILFESRYIEYYR